MSLPPTLDDSDAAFSRYQLRAATIAGVRWVVITRVVFELAAFSSTIALARLIAPDEVGRAAVALVLPMLAVILTFEGFGSILVQRRHITESLERTAVTLSMLSGALLTVLTGLFSRDLAAELFDARTAHLLLLISPVFLVAALGAVPRSRLQRRLDFRLISVIEVTAFVVGVSVALSLAVAGRGGAALVAGGLVNAFTETLLMLLAVGMPRPGLKARDLHRVVAFGAPASLAGVAFSLRRNLDYLILGATLAPGAVGLYYRAFQLGAEYQAKISGIMLRIVFPLFSRTTDLAHLRVVRARVVQTNALLVLPLLGLLIVVMPDLVPLMYGERWGPAVQPAQVLALAGMALALLSGSEPLALATGRPRTLLQFNFVFLVVYAVALTAVTPGSLVDICIAVVAVHLVMLGIAQRMLVTGSIGLPFRQLFSDAGPAVVSTAIGIGICFPIAAELRPILGAAGVLTVVPAIGCLVYVGVLYVLFRSALLQLRSVARQVLGLAS